MPKKSTTQCWEIRYYRLGDKRKRVGAGPLVSMYNATSKTAALKLFKIEHKLPHEIVEVVVSKYTMVTWTPCDPAERRKLRRKANGATKPMVRRLKTLEESLAQGVKVTVSSPGKPDTTTIMTTGRKRLRKPKQKDTK